MKSKIYTGECIGHNMVALVLSKGGHGFAETMPQINGFHIDVLRSLVVASQFQSCCQCKDMPM